MKPTRALIILIVLLLIVAAAPRTRIDELIRRGNDAFEARDFAGAIRLYEQAEALTTDPGLVAFNKAVALYQLASHAKAPHEKTGLFRRAEEHYRCAADDPAEPRRLLACFGLANSLLQGRSEEIAAVRRAIAYYRDCLQSNALDDQLMTDARHNLEVAKLTLLRLQAKPNPEKDPPDHGDDPQKKPPKQEPDPMKKPGMGDPTMGERQPTESGDPVETKPGDKATPTKKHAPGSGDMETRIDETPTPPLSAQAAEQELDEAIKRIREKQLLSRLRSSRLPPPGVKDW